MAELLAPAGDLESFYTAVNSGCDAVYLGLEKFSARAYAKNFSFEDLKTAINYAHLCKVKVYVTMNTIIFEDELQEAYKCIDELAKLNIDGIIIQDLALGYYIKNNYPTLEAHASTQTGIDSLEGIRFYEMLDYDRVVLAREVPIEKIKEFKKLSKMPLEVFIHGALCVSYSGNCLMSGLIGMRSGNRGRCIGNCRKSYKVINGTTNEVINESFILSMKDLNTINNIKDLLFIDSLKIEGRMKENAYIRNVISSYRQAIDEKNPDFKEINKNLNKTFQRTFTKGYLFGEDPKNIVNIDKPNNQGYPIGKIIGKKNGYYEISLSEPLYQNDVIRIDSKEEINIKINKLYDNKFNIVNVLQNKGYLKFVEKANINDIIYKTKDNQFINEMNKKMSYFKKFPISVYANLKKDCPISINLLFEDINISVQSEQILTEAKTTPISKENVVKTFNKLNDTPYFIDSLEIDMDDNLFISLKELNNIKNKAIEMLNEKRLNHYHKQSKKVLSKGKTFEINEPKLSVFCTTYEQYLAALEENVDIIYYDNYVKRNNTKYVDVKDEVLVGGYNGVYHYQGKKIVSDFSLNVVNSSAVKLLHDLNVERITLSHELNKNQIDDLINQYYLENNGYPNLEMIVYGYVHLLNTKYCPLRKLNLCGQCKKNQYYLDDGLGQFRILSHDDCTTTILNGKRLNLLDDLDKINNVNVFRLQFTVESKEEVKKIINIYRSKKESFNNETDTRGHFYRKIV